MSIAGLFSSCVQCVFHFAALSHSPDDQLNRCCFLKVNHCGLESFISTLLYLCKVSISFSIFIQCIKYVHRNCYHFCSVIVFYAFHSLAATVHGLTRRLSWSFNAHTDTIRICVWIYAYNKYIQSITPLRTHTHAGLVTCFHLLSLTHK